MVDITLYGTPLSLYTGRARSYLIKAGRAYREITPTSAHYRENVVPKAGGRQGIPTIETTTGEVIRDGAAIIDHFEASTGSSFSPKTPKQNIISRLFDVIGAEGLLRPAMHYRWNFPELNLEFLKFHFESVMPRGPGRADKAAKAADRMRAACMGFGAVPPTFSLIESLYAELLGKLDHHFSQHPYLLGGRPCIGDFGMIAPLYGHLGRDPKPLSLMQARAVRVFRGVERMNRPEPDAGEFEVQDASYLVDDQVPDSLVEVLKQVAIDFMPETRAAADCINAWLEAQKDGLAGTAAPRGVGASSFTVRGVSISALAQPYRFYLLQRVQDEFVSLDQSARERVRSLLARCDMEQVLDIKLSRRIGRANNLEVWLPA